MIALSMALAQLAGPATIFGLFRHLLRGAETEVVALQEDAGLEANIPGSTFYE